MRLPFCYMEEPYKASLTAYNFSHSNCFVEPIAKKYFAFIGHLRSCR